MKSAEQTVLAYTDALYAQRFDEAASFLYPGDLDRLRVMLLNSTQALAAFWEEHRLVSALGISLESLSEPATFGPNVLAGMSRRIRSLPAALGTIDQEILAVEENGETASVTVRTQRLPAEGADPRLRERLAGQGATDKVHQLQRIGARWYLMLGDGLHQQVNRVRHDLSAFKERAARDLVAARPDTELHAFRIHGFRDASHRTVIEPRFSAASDFSEGLAAVRFFTQWGYIDAAGKTVIEPRFSEASDFSEGFAAVAIEGDDRNDLWGYIDSAGVWLIEPKFERAREYKDNRAAVRCEGLWGYVDHAGIQVIAAQFTEAGAFEDGAAEVEGEDGTAYFIDPNGSVIEVDDRNV